MLLLNRRRFEEAVQAMTVAARTATDEDGLAVVVPLPYRGSAIDLDQKRIEAIVLGAIVALANGPARLADETPLKMSDLCP